ncbi:DUF3667 domain-containing protein [Polaribacter gangjinensis]|uniref:DUF3667 domain-containing protein n=1 Tax=Polaribacter gangjinensis TaxID=574710 RepID=A0A2S7WFE3_9FLAO|nr:DUF3667 domain-containing protein [Polaribacter gangjinensis]PQJ75962.1 hypothetical protein BTO13_12330 [Polaribacter gangjinensis]
MNCKNCQEPLNENSQFCNNCGGKVVAQRITFKKLFVDFFINVFGVDNKFFLTLRKILTNPENVINEYLDGVRNRYINPFAFLAIGAGLSLLVFNYFADDFIEVNNAIQSDQINELKQKATLDLSTVKNIDAKQFQKLEIEKKTAQMQLKFMSGWMQFTLRYYNLLTFVFLLIYAVLSKWTYRKPHNFGEHVVINAFIYGFLTYVTLLFFIFAVFINPSIYSYSIVAYILFYMYAFGRIYKLSIGKNILKLFRFIFGLVIFFISLMIVGVIAGIALKYFDLI